MLHDTYESDKLRLVIRNLHQPLSPFSSHSSSQASDWGRDRGTLDYHNKDEFPRVSIREGHLIGIPCHVPSRLTTATGAVPCTMPPHPLALGPGFLR